MKKRLITYYQSLSLIKKLSIPLMLSLLFGILLTVMIIKQVGIINNNTYLLKNELIPALEQTTNNRTLLQKISENLTFATLAEEEDMLSEINDNISIEKNLNKIISNKNLPRNQAKTSLVSFKKYFKISTEFALSVIQEKNMNNDLDIMNILLNSYNDVKHDFLKLKNEIEREIAKKTALIEKTSKDVIYFTSLYVIVFSIVLFFLSYLVYKDFNERIKNLSSSLNSLGIQKELLENDDTLGHLSKNIKQTVRDYSIIEAQRKELSSINKKINESIEYASLIQEAILPSTEILNHYAKDAFVYWKPRDTVGGDIYFISELKSKNEIIIMVIDGVGHGVSGAFLTMLVKALETQIISRINNNTLEASPAKILQYFNKSIKIMLNQDKGSKSNTGFDGGVLYYNKAKKTCKYAGAKTPLYIIKNNQVKVIKSDRKNVGFIRTKIDQEYTEYEINIEKGTKLYITTDGITDQEGTNNNTYGKDKFQKLLLSIHQEKLEKQKQIIIKSFLDFKKTSTQSDDITIFGIEF